MHVMMSLHANQSGLGRRPLWPLWGPRCTKSSPKLHGFGKPCKSSNGGILIAGVEIEQRTTYCIFSLQGTQSCPSTPGVSLLTPYMQYITYSICLFLDNYYYCNTYVGKMNRHESSSQTDAARGGTLSGKSALGKLVPG